jgi:hypothetical protein
LSEKTSDKPNRGEIAIRSIDHERHEIDAVAWGPIHYLQIEKHLLEERNVGAISYKEFIDARDAGVAFAGSPSEIRHIFALVRSLGRQSKFGPTAVLVSTDFALGIMRAMEVLLEDVADIRPFFDEKLARSWLASKPNGQ